jgi:hypothetical protein
VYNLQENPRRTLTPSSRAGLAPPRPRAAATRTGLTESFENFSSFPANCRPRRVRKEQKPRSALLEPVAGSRTCNFAATQKDPRASSAAMAMLAFRFASSNWSWKRQKAYTPAMVRKLKPWCSAIATETAATAALSQPRASSDFHSCPSHPSIFIRPL